MALVRDGRIVADPYGDSILGLDEWLATRDRPGVRLRSDQHPRAIAGDLGRIAVVALEFPSFRDGRPFTYARLLRERWSYEGEIRAVGDVLAEQLHLMLRSGFDAFELPGPDPLRDWHAAAEEFHVWYQATGDGRLPARLLRHRRSAIRRIA